MNLQTLTNDVRAQSQKLASFGHTLKFEIEEMGMIWIDARTTPPMVSNDDLDADCIISMTQNALQKVLVENSMSPVLAMSLGEITIEGARDVGERFLTIMPEQDDGDVWDHGDGAGLPSP